MVAITLAVLSLSTIVDGLQRAFPFIALGLDGFFLFEVKLSRLFLTCRTLGVRYSWTGRAKRKVASVAL